MKKWRYYARCKYCGKKFYAYTRLELDRKEDDHYAKSGHGSFLLAA